MIQKNLHILNRLTFGPNFETVDRYLQLRPIDLVKLLFEESKGYRPIRGPLKARFPYIDYSGKRGRKQKVKHRQAMKRNKQVFAHRWLEEMAHTDQQIREKMALFWHDHFATSIANPVKTADQINWIRKHALGSYKNLLIGVSKGPAMIDYLHNKQNTKSHPNEDYAREVLELFSMGEGNYTEKDIQEAARAFTGWEYDKEGTFRVNPKTHDDGIKTFMGQQGNWTGEDILDMILRDNRTAQYITSKIYYYLTGVPITRDLLDVYSQVFAKRFNVTQLIKKIVNAPRFHDTSIQATRVKSPVELLIGSMRLMKVEFTFPSLPVKMQVKMDQLLLSPPNVAGWRSGPDWLTTGTLLDRMLLCRNLYSDSVSQYLKHSELTTEGDQVVVYEDRVDTTQLIKEITLIPVVNWVKNQGQYGLLAFAEIVYGRNLTPIESRIHQLNDQVNKGTTAIDEAILTLTSLPEYQMH